MVLASTGTGDIIPNATVTVRNPGTTTNISETIYVNDDPDLSQYVNGNFQTSATGIVVFYLTNQKRVDVLFTKAGFTSVTIPVDVQKSSLVSGESVAASTIWDAAGDLAKGTGADTAARLARGTANQVLRTNAGATDIEWGVEQARDIVTTAGDITYATAADTLARLGIGTAGQVLKVNSGATAPEWGAAAAASIGDLLDCQFARKTVEETVTSSTVLQNDDELFIPVGVNQTWKFECFLMVYGAEAGDIKIGFTGPAGAVLKWGGLGLAAALTGGTTGDAQFRYAEGANTVSYGIEPTIGTTILISGIILTSVTAGNLQLQWAQDTSNATATAVTIQSHLMGQRFA